jgi:hypothetical protein
MQRHASGNIRAAFLSIAVFCLTLPLLWLTSAAVLWWAYDMSASIRGGAYDQNAAKLWVIEFGCVLCGVAAVVWIWARRKIPELSKGRMAWRVCWQTAGLLFLYAVVIMVRRQTWTPDMGESDWAMFFGNLNARFFSEAGVLSFVFCVLPLVSVASAALFLLQGLLSECLAISC